MSDKPLRGPTRPLDPAWMSLEYIDPRDFPPSTVVWDEQQHATPVLPPPGPLLLSYDPGSSDATCVSVVVPSDDIQMSSGGGVVPWRYIFDEQVRSIIKAVSLPPPLPEDLHTRMQKSIDNWINTTFGVDRSFYVRCNYGRVPSKRQGRKGTRRAWKRAHPPRLVTYGWDLVLPSVFTKVEADGNEPVRDAPHDVALSPGVG